MRAPFVLQLSITLEISKSILVDPSPGDVLFFSIITWAKILPHRGELVREATLHFYSRNYRTLRLRLGYVESARRAIHLRCERNKFVVTCRAANRGLAIYAQNLTCVGLIHQPLIDFHHRWHVCQGFAERRHVAAIAFDGFFTGIIGRERELQIAVEACQ